METLRDIETMGWTSALPSSQILPMGGPDLKETGSSSWWGQSHQGAGLPEKYISLRPPARIVGFFQHLLATMRRSWLGLQLVLSCALLLAVVAVEGRCCKEEESSSEEECHCEKRHHCVEECCEKRCHHEKVEECCCCCEKRRHHEDEECCKKKHSHGKEESGKKKHSRAEEEEEADENKDPHDGKRHPKKRHPLLEELEEASSDSSELYERLAKEEQQRIAELAAQTSDAVPHYRKEQAIAHFNRGNEGSYYKHLEDGQLEFKVSRNPLGQPKPLHSCSYKVIRH